jgi:hypothetical protein
VPVCSHADCPPPCFFRSSATSAALEDLQYDTLALAGLMIVAMVIAVTRFCRTLD